MDVGAMLAAAGTNHAIRGTIRGPRDITHLGWRALVAATGVRRMTRCPPPSALLIFSMEILVRTGGRHERVEPSGPSAALLNGSVGAKK